MLINKLNHESRYLNYLLPKTTLGFRIHWQSHWTFEILGKLFINLQRTNYAIATCGMLTTFMKIISTVCKTTIKSEK